MVKVIEQFQIRLNHDDFQRLPYANITMLDACTTSEAVFLHPEKCHSVSPICS